MISLIDESVEAGTKIRHAEARQDGSTRPWRWRVEPGMEEAFDDLLGWMLSSQQDAAARMESAPQDSPTSGKLEAAVGTAPASRAASPWALCMTLCCGQAS